MTPPEKTFISVIVPCYNEQAILPINLTTIINYLDSKSHKYRWEIIIINDGSKDKTGAIANEFATRRSEVRVIHHPVNLNLGHALQNGFRHSKGDVIVVLDVDLSYSVEYVGEMAE